MPAPFAHAVREVRGGHDRVAFYGEEADAASCVGREYTAAREGTAIVDLSDRGIIAVHGPLRAKFLHNLLSHDVQTLQAGQTRLATLLDVKGHLVSTMRVLATGDALLLEVPAERLDVVEKALLHYKVGTPVRFAVKPTAIFAVLGPGAHATLQAAAVALPDAVMPGSFLDSAIAGHAVHVIRAADMPAGGLVVQCLPEAAGPVVQAIVDAGALPVGRRALDALRIEDGRPWFGTDVGEQNLLHETGLVDEYSSPNKGCYVGQEVVARLIARGGNVSKQVRGLRLGAESAPGAVIHADGKDVGRVTTAAVSPRLGPIAMGFVHRSRFEPGSTVEIDGAPATVSLLPLRH